MPQQTYDRIETFHVEGVNTFSSWNVAKREQLSHCENVTSPGAGTVERRLGYQLIGDDINATENFGVFPFNSDNVFSKGLWRISTVGGTTAIRYLNTSDVWTALAGDGTGLLYVDNPASVVVAEGRCFIVNGEDENRMIEEDGITTVLGTTVDLTNDFYKAPRAAKVNFYKGRLYLADVTYDGVRYQNQVQISSPLLGVVSLVDGDWTAALSSTTINVTDTKYIYPTDTLDVFRGDDYIATLDVTAKTETSITVSSIPFDLQSSDELWVNLTNPNISSGRRRFRWAVNATGGMPVKKFDTFLLSGGNNGPIKMLTNVGPYQIIANDDVMATWDGQNAQVNDTGIGCVSRQGYVRFSNLLYFIHWTGIYTTSGGDPKLVSTPVDLYIRGATRSGLENAVAGRKGFSVFFHIGDVTLRAEDGSIAESLTDVVLEYDIREDSWFVQTGIPVSNMCTFVDETDPDRLVMATDSPAGRMEVFGLFEGDLDDGAEIPYRIDFAHWQLCKSEENVAEPKTVVAHIDRGNSAGCYVSLDNEPFYQIKGQFDKGVSVIPVTARDPSRSDPVRCRRIKISIRGAGLARTRLAKMAVNYTQTSEQEENDRDQKQR